ANNFTMAYSNGILDHGSLTSRSFFNALSLSRVPSQLANSLRPNTSAVDNSNVAVLMPRHDNWLTPIFPSMYLPPRLAMASSNRQMWAATRVESSTTYAHRSVHPC